MKINNNAQNFCGYKNIITNVVEDEIGRTYSLSAQLNNVGERDLDKFLSIKDRMDKTGMALKDDVVNLTLVKNFKGENQLLIEDTPWLSGEDLDILSKEIPGDIYQKIETNILKGYDFVSSLLKRISEDLNIQKDDFISKTIDSYKQNILKLSDTQEIADEVVALALTEPEPPQKVAKKMNQFITDTMEYLFS